MQSVHYTHFNEFVSFLCVADPSKVTTPGKLSVGKNNLYLEYEVCIIQFVSTCS